jgi:hypothetical protein
VTKLKTGNGTQRETATLIQGRPLLVELHPRHVVLRLKGRRYRYELAWESAWNRAAEIEGRRRMVERRERARMRRKQREHKRRQYD